MITKIFTIKWINKVLKNHDNINWQTINNILSNNQYLDNYLPPVYNKIKGDLFEIITKYMLLQEYKICYFYQEIPNQLKQLLKLPNQDRGIDLICSNDNINFIGIQCKWRSNINQSIKKCYVTEFLHEINNSKLKYGIMVTNVKKITPTFNKIQNLKWILNNTLDKKINKDTLNNILNSLLTIIKPPIKETKNIELRNYQQEAINALINCNNPNKKCIMACGTGKTIVMLEYINKKGLNNKKILFLFPSLHLINQIYKNFMNKFNNKNVLCICSQMDKLTLTQNEANEERAEELLNNFLALDTENKFTTDINIINERLKQNEIIVFCTYQSSELLKDQFFDIGIYDEAHKTVNNKTFGFTLSNGNCNIKERLYFTATPKYFKGPKDKCISMNNIEVYGNDVYNYTFKKAIEEKYILDFKIIGYVVNKEIADIIEEKYINKDDISFPRDVIISAIMLAEHVKKNGNCKKILTYHNTVNNALEYKKILDYIFNIYKINVSIFTMSGNTNITHREEIINEFSQADIGIICSARVLNEGIDIPCVDTVLFAETRKSTIDVTQCVGRAMRLYPSNDYCNIIIPIHYDNLLGDHNFSSIINILTAMKEIDDKIIEYFVGRKEGNKIAVKNMEYCEVIEDELQVKYNIYNVIGKMECRMMDSVSLGWDMKRLLLFEYVDTFKKIPTKKITYNNKRVGQWLQDQKNRMHGKESDTYIKLSVNELVKQNLDEYLKKCEINKDKKKLSHDEILKLFFEYCDKKQKIPTEKINYKNINIGKWYQHQKYKIDDKTNKIYIELSANNLVKLNLEKYLENSKLNKDKEILTFNESLNLLFEYCDKMQAVPNHKIVYRNKKIGSWLNTQKCRINNMSDDIYIKLSKNKLVKENLDKYLNLQESNKDKERLPYDKTLNLLFEYCDREQTVPTHNVIYKKKYIGRWLQQQKNKIKNTNDNNYIILSKNNIIKKDLDKYLKKKLESNKNNTILTFEESTNLLFEYCNKENSLPVETTIYKNKKLGRWFQSQKKNINSINDKVYIKLSSNQLVKDNLDKYLEKAKLNKNNKIFTFDESLKLFFEYCDEKKIIPIKNTIYKNKNIGSWFQNQKKKIASENSEIYIKLSENKLAKKNMDEYLKKSKLNKDKEIITFDESLTLLFEYCDEMKIIPTCRTIYKNKNIGAWLQNQKKLIDNYTNEKYIKLCESKLVKENLDEYLKKRELNKDKEIFAFDKSLKLLFEYCNETQTIPTCKTIYKNKNIGAWLNTQKNKLNDVNDVIYIKLSENILVKENLDKYLENIKLNKDKEILPFDESLKLLFEYCNEMHTMPNYKTIHKNKYIGAWFHAQKQKINNNNSEIYIKLSENQLVKKKLDEYLKKNRSNKVKKIFTFDESLNLLFEYCNSTKTIPTCKTIYENKNIGDWLNKQKNKINDVDNEIYIKLSKNTLIKKNLDEYLKKKNNCHYNL